MEVDVVNTENEKVGTATLPDEIFCVEVNEGLIWEQVKAQRASRRRGTHATKTRANVSGGGAKPYRQKGTGRARQGSSRAPNHVGGGTVFGPHPRSYAYRLPKSARKAALRSALSLRTGEQQLVILADFPLEAPRTAAVQVFLKKIGTSSALIVDGANDNLRLSARNLPKAKYLAGGAVNVYDVLDHAKLVITQAALADVVKKASPAARGEAAATA